MNYKELLFNKDKTLTFFPELAVILNEYDKYLAKIGYEINGKKWKSSQKGLNAAIVINQINYWNDLNEKLKSKKHFKDGYYWTFHTYENWAEEDFPYWSADTVRRTVRFLEDMGIVVSTDKYNIWKVDNTKWYRIDYDKLQKAINVVEELRKPKETDNEKQVAETVNADCDCVMATCTDSLGNATKPIPEITNRDYNTEITDTDITEKGDTTNKFVGEVDTSVSEQKPTAKSNKRTYSELKELETDMLKRVVKICDNNLGFSQSKTKEVLELFEYYLYKYTQKTGKIHPILTDSTLERIINELLAEREDDENHKHFEGILEYEGVAEAMIDTFFEKGLGEGTDYHLSHFATNGVLINLGCRANLGEI